MELTPSTKREFEALLEQSSDIVSVLDETGRLLYQSPSAERVLGYEPHEVAGDNVFEYVHPDDRGSVMALYEEMVETPGTTTERVEYRFRHADGSWIWLESVGSNRQHTELDGYVVNSRDVTERKRLERRYEQFVEYSSDFVAVLDDEGVVRYVSQAVERICGYAPDDVVGEDAFSYVHPDDVNEAVREVERGIDEPGYTATVDHRFRHADGSWIWLESRGRSLPDPGPLEGRIVINSRDISERKRRERELSRQNERLDRFTSVVSHDLRNPLTVLEGNLEMARETGDPEYFDRCSRALDRMERLIDDLLAVAREGESVTEPESVELVRVAERAWETVETAEADLSVDADDRLEADPGRLRELLENLFRNAVEHGGDSVSVTVGTGDDCFYVADDGPGIADDVADEVFEFGYSSSRDGTGFGLAIVAEIADAHGWDVAVAESDSGGARIEVRDVEFV